MKVIKNWWKIVKYDFTFWCNRNLRQQCKQCAAYFEGHDCAFPDCSPWIWQTWFVYCYVRQPMGIGEDVMSTIFWFRVCGKGLSFAYNKQPLFSERHGYRKVLRIGKFSVEVL